MRTIEIRIVVEDNGSSLDITTHIDGSSPPASTMEIVGIMELAKKQFITAKEARKAMPDADCVTLPNGDCVGPDPCIHTPRDTSSRAPDGAPWYAHLDGPCGPECGTLPEPPGGWAAHDAASVRESQEPYQPLRNPLATSEREDQPAWVVRAACGLPYPCEHAPDGGNHPTVAGT
jgi:hypothetical protein